MKSTTCDEVLIAGGGLAGSEAAWQLAQRGVRVTLLEMRPNRMTPAHATGLLGELVCSNSLGADGTSSPAGILKQELRRMGSLIMRAADASRVPAGGALAVDREKFAAYIDTKLSAHPLASVVRQEVTDIPAEPAIIATGPLTGGALAEKLKSLTGDGLLYFYDAASPIVTLESIDMGKAFKGSRYGKGADYINCPMNEEEYHAFWEALVAAETALLHDFDEPPRHFEGCLPIEVMARRGPKTLLFGPLRPVGLEEGRGCCAVVQLRQDNSEGTLFNMVGFQTNLKWSEQKRVFRMIPALRNAEFVRMGVMHRNMFVCAPKVLDGCLRLAGRDALFLAGQVTGVEGYMESTAMGMAASVFMYCAISGRPLPKFPRETAIGSLLDYLVTAMPDTFQPMNVNLGIFPKLPGGKIHDRSERCTAYAIRSAEALESFIAQNPQLLI